MFIFKRSNNGYLESIVYILISKFFTLWASRSHRIYIVAARVRLGRLAVDFYSFMGRCLNLNVRVGWVGLNSLITQIVL
jgi:hypothetical protein